MSITENKDERPIGRRALPLAGRLGPRATARTGGKADGELHLVVGDITLEASDAIVNPAGPGLVDLAIRRAAGPSLLEAFHQTVSLLPERKLLRGRALVTPAFELTARHVIHCGPPVYADDPAQARVDLAGCYREALRLAREGGLKSISFPAIGTGVYRYPARSAAEVAVATLVADLRAHATPSLVRVVLFDRPMLDIYIEASTRAGVSFGPR